MERAVAMNGAKSFTAVDSVAPSPGGSAFPNTQWSMVLNARGATDTEARLALESLCRIYWPPLYTFIRRQGREHHDAQDATQQFIAHLLATESLQRVEPERGRFRTFLLTALKNFLTSEWRRTQTAKRGGGFTAVDLNSAHSAESSHLELPDPALTPERAFDRRWAQTMIERAVAELRAEYEGSGRKKIFAIMAPLIWGMESDDAISTGAFAMGITPNAFCVALHRARRRLGERLRANIAETVADPREMDVELRHLMEAMKDER